MKRSRLRLAFSRAALILSAVAVTSCGRPVPTPPIPKGHAGIHVEFKKLTSAQFDDLTQLVQKMAEDHSAYYPGSTTVRQVGDGNAYQGFWNDGYVDQAYKPDHPVPSPKVEADMKASLDAFLLKNKIDPAGVKLELRYGP